ncbi:hypothetical protein BKA70DRAFT_1222855 [Coprinopsis sp. MPI-PUGE-AT-0042]|nr:hypothetical protein BKA70DRAFT_1222855 [Coprinopsis sp. MPI-PUGE-AT-0042]
MSSSSSLITQAPLSFNTHPRTPQPSPAMMELSPSSPMRDIPSNSTQHSHQALPPHSSSPSNESYQQGLEKAFSDLMRLEAAMARTEDALASERFRFHREMKRRQMKMKGFSKSASLMASAYLELTRIIMLEEDE